MKKIDSHSPWRFHVSLLLAGISGLTGSAGSGQLPEVTGSAGAGQLLRWPLDDT